LTPFLPDLCLPPSDMGLELEMFSVLPAARCPKVALIRVAISLRISPKHPVTVQARAKTSSHRKAPRILHHSRVVSDGRYAFKNASSCLWMRNPALLDGECGGSSKCRPTCSRPVPCKQLGVPAPHSSSGARNGVVQPVLSVLT
jgi:hypothetical protein